MGDDGQIKKAFGNTLRELRLERNISQEELAAISGVDRSYVSLIERGINSPSLIMIYNLCKGLDIPVSKLFERMEKDND